MEKYLKMEQKKTFQIGIKQIKDLGFSVNEEINVDSDSGIQIQSNLVFNKEENTIELILSFSFFRKSDNQTFMSGRTSNLFFVPDLVNFENTNNPDTFDIPDGLIYTIISLSYSHSRALLAQNAVGTKFAHIYLPIKNPVELSQDLFKNMQKK